MGLAPGAWTFGLPPIALGAAMLFLPIPFWAGAAVLILGLGVLAFHRDPHREPGPGIVSPCDGRVAEAATGPGGGYVAVFLNLHNVHVVRAPMDATVEAVVPKPGPKRPAWAGGARHNAGVELRLRTPDGPVRLRMLCGFLARRVVPYVEPGDELAKGERIGLIRFGSRVELVLPANAHTVVDAGTRVRAGETQVAEVVP